MSGEKFIIKYGAMDQLYMTVCERIDSWNTQLDNWVKSYTKLVELDSFQGKTATSVKNYLQEVHGVMVYAIKQMLIDYQVRLLQYSSGYYNIDANIYSVLHEETIDTVINKMKTESGKLDTIHSSIGTSLNATSDLLSLSNPSKFTLQDTLDGLKTELTEYAESIVDYETQHCTDVADNLETLIASVKSAVDSLINGGTSMVDYATGTLASNTAVLDMYQKVVVSQEYVSGKQEEIQEAAELKQAAFEQMQADYEAACQERADKGVSTIIMGGLAVIAGGAAIILTAGAATPIVVTAAVAGTSSILYGASNMIEGSQDVYYGLNGDLTSGAFNPIRDTIFMGNQGVYDAWGSLSLTVAGLCVPVNSAVNGVAGSGGWVMTKTVVKTVAVETAKDVVIDKATDTIVTYVDENVVDLGHTGKTLLTIGVNAGLDKGADVVGEKFGYGGDKFTDKMSYDEAKRYNQYWDGKESGASVDAPDMADVDTPKVDPAARGDAPEFDPTARGNADGAPKGFENDSTAPDTVLDDPTGAKQKFIDKSVEAQQKYVDEAVGAKTDYVNESAGARQDFVDKYNNGGETDAATYDGTNHGDMTPEQRAQVLEMEENGEFVFEEKRGNKVIKQDYGAVETTTNFTEVKDPGYRLPTEKNGTIIGDRDSGTFEYIPDDPKAKKIMAEYGQDTIKYNDKAVDFSPYTKQDTPKWGTVDGEVQIENMSGGRTQAGGNYAQADEALARKITEETGIKVEASEIKKYRESSGRTWHETEDGYTMQLVPTEINKAAAHRGGTSIKAEQQQLGDVSHYYE